MSTRKNSRARQAPAGPVGEELGGADPSAARTADPSDRSAEGRPEADEGPDPTADRHEGPAAGLAAGRAEAEEAGDTADFVTFVVEEETYAFAMEQVEEIIRMPQVIRVPLGPPSLVGLANLRGRILPVVSLRACCGLDERPADEATRVVVVDGGAPLGLVVDRVASVTSVAADRVEPVDTISEVIASDLLRGVIKPAAADDQLTKVLDVVRLVATQFRLLGDLDAVAVAGDGAAAARQAGEAGQDESDDTLELVSFAVDGQEYALPIDLVQEIVQAPEQVTTVPHVDPSVLGVMDLRGKLLPVVSLRQVFGLRQGALEAHNRIVVVHVPEEGGEPGTRGTGETGVVGVVMDTVREVLRVPHELVADLPEFMSRAGRAAEVDAVCRLEDGQRLVSVLSVEKLFASGALGEAVREAAGDQVTGGWDADEEYEVATDRDGAEGEDELLVVFRLAEEEYSVDVDAVQEIIRVPETLIRVPKALDFVEGLVNLRGAVLPVVDLRTRLGLERAARDERQRIIVLIVGGVRTGFIVDSVTEVLRVGRGDLEPAPELSAEQAQLISQVANLPGEKRMLMMLEPDHLLAADQLAGLIPQPREGADVLAAAPLGVG